jgi:hypothetical protein
MSLKLSPLVREWLKKAYVPATGELFWFAFEPDRIRSIVKPVWFYHGSGDIDFVCSQGHQFGMSLIEIRQISWATRWTRPGGPFGVRSARR